MDNNQLLKALDFILCNKYHVVLVTSNQLFNLSFRKDKDTFCVVHISEENSSIGHWVVFEVSCVDHSAYFFDSYALDFHQYFDRVPFHIRGQNRRPIQNESTSNCGMFVLYYVFCRVTLKLSPNRIQNSFKTNTDLRNDTKVEHFYINLKRRMNEKIHKHKNIDLKACCMCDFLKGHLKK